MRLPNPIPSPMTLFSSTATEVASVSVVDFAMVIEGIVDSDAFGGTRISGVLEAEDDVSNKFNDDDFAFITLVFEIVDGKK
jgi:hypothetical protein